MAQFPGMTLWTDSWIADTHHLTGRVGMAKIGVYISLLVVMWRTPGCRVPNDDVWLMNRLHLSPDEVRDILRPVITEFCQTDANYLYQKRQRHEYARRFELGAAQSVRAKHRRNKKKDISPELAAVSDPAKPLRAKPPYPYPTTVITSSFPTAATPVDSSERVAKKQQENPARSLASAPDVGALTREPDNEPAEPKQSANKKPEEMTLAEINAIRYGRR